MAHCGAATLTPRSLVAALQVSKRQEGNPVLRHVRNVRWQVRRRGAALISLCAERCALLAQFADIVPDYILGNGTAALYISVRYHLLHPDYLFFRIRELQRRCGSAAQVYVSGALALTRAPRAASGCAWCCATWTWRTW